MRCGAALTSQGRTHRTAPPTGNRSRRQSRSAPMRPHCKVIPAGMVAQHCKASLWPCVGGSSALELLQDSSTAAYCSGSVLYSSLDRSRTIACRSALAMRRRLPQDSTGWQMYPARTCAVLFLIGRQTWRRTWRSTTSDHCCARRSTRPSLLARTVHIRTLLSSRWCPPFHTRPQHTLEMETHVYDYTRRCTHTRTHTHHRNRSSFEA